MKILHTGDWHIGKQLEGVSRIEEQQKALMDMTAMVKAENIDLILIAGDVYDTFNPSSQAETLFYKTLKDMSEEGKRLIVVIPGNHDNPKRLVAASPLAREHGIILIDSLKTILETGTYGEHQLLKSGPGYIEIEIHDEKAVILTVPYPSEKRLEESYLSLGLNDEQQLMAYNEKIREMFVNLSKHFREDTLNIVMSHLFVTGAEETGSERSIQLGGSYIIDGSCFPKNADYVALGHIHKPMVIPGTMKRIRYSGSPLQYNKKERHYTKGCYVMTMTKTSFDITFKTLPIYKPIEVWTAESIEEALDMCKEKSGESSYVYLSVKTDRFIQEHEIKTMKHYKDDLLEIIPILEQHEVVLPENITEEPIQTIFEKFYLKEKQVMPTKEITSLLLEILGEEDETH